MQELAPLLTLGTAGLAATGMTAAAALRGWQDWLDVRRAAAEARQDETPRRTIADLRARVRRLEAIANGSDH
jgi:hypothetical protein